MGLHDPNTCFKIVSHIIREVASSKEMVTGVLSSTHGSATHWIHYVTLGMPSRSNFSKVASHFAYFHIWRLSLKYLIYRDAEFLQRLLTGPGAVYAQHLLQPGSRGAPKSRGHFWKCWHHQEMFAHQENGDTKLSMWTLRGSTFLNFIQHFENMNHY